MYPEGKAFMISGPFYIVSVEGFPVSGCLAGHGKEGIFLQRRLDKR